MISVIDIRFQKRIRRWVESRLGLAAMDPGERAMRMLEEAAELAQALGVAEEQFRLIGRHVWSKPKGEIYQELGGAALTLAACAEAM